MIGILIFSLLSFCSFFILTRVVWIKMRYCDGLKIEIHLPILAIEFSKGNFSEEKNMRKRGKSSSIHRAFPHILSYLNYIIEHCEIIIYKVSLPSSTEPKWFCRYIALYHATIGYLGSRAKRIFIADDALILFSNEKTFSVDFTLKTELFRLLYTVIAIFFQIKQNRKVKRVGK